MMRHYSYAGENSGSSDPDDITVVLVDETECPRDQCGHDATHLVVMWSGDEYSNNNTWISADEDTYKSLEETR